MNKDMLSTIFEDVRIRYSLIKKRYVILFFIILMSIIVALYWQGENKNMSIRAELDILSIEPKDSSLSSTIEILFNNNSGKQIENITCNCSEILYQGETQIVVVDNIIHNNFDILLTMDGKWDRATVNLRLYGTDKSMESFVITASNPPVLYNIPKDVSNERYFKINNFT